MKRLLVASFQIAYLKGDNFSFSPKDHSDNSKVGGGFKEKALLRINFVSQEADRIPASHYWGCFGRTA